MAEDVCIKSLFNSFLGASWKHTCCLDRKVQESREGAFESGWNANRNQIFATPSTALFAEKSSRYSRSRVIRCVPKWKRRRFYFRVGHPATLGEKKNPNLPKTSDGCRQTKSGGRWRRILPLQIASGDVLHNVMISLFGITSDDRHRSWNSQLTEYKTATALMNDLRGCSRHIKSWWSFLGWRFF